MKTSPHRDPLPALRPLPPPPGEGRGEGARRAFTLVELLVVVGIIAVLAALLLPAVMRVRVLARNSAIKAEIDMLHMAMMNYKNEYGSFPPATTSIQLPVNLTAINRRQKHLMRVFPRIAPLIDNNGQPRNDRVDRPALDQLELATTGSTSAGSGGRIFDNTSLNGIEFGPNTALVFWLGGYTQNPASPLYPSADRKKLYDFDESRKEIDETTGRFNGLYHSPQMRGKGFYRYIDNGNYYFTNAGNTFPTQWVEFDPKTAAMAVGEDSYVTNGNVDVNSGFTEDANANGAIDRGRPFNADTFQIIHPGIDGIFGNDDDLSNFWKGTRRDYLDSLNN